MLCRLKQINLSSVRIGIMSQWVKLPPATPASHMVWDLAADFQLCSPVICLERAVEDGPGAWVLHPHGRPRGSSWGLALQWPSPCHCSYLEMKAVDGKPRSPPLSKYKTVFSVNQSSLKIYFVYFKGRVELQEKKWVDFPCTNLLPKWPQLP